MTLRIAFSQTVLLENCLQGNKVQETKRELTFLFLSTPWYTITQCVALTLAFLCGLGAKNQERESKTARKVFWLSFHFSRGQNRKSPSSVFLCSETKRKRLLCRPCLIPVRRLPRPSRSMYPARQSLKGKGKIYKALERER